ncbi:unnamed protein product [Clonostachys rosea]|uniref:RGS domain-containing protein n=1 Tax=Bionectria ochroleuca TaxID=29856 RepID=A0ABY6TTI4_BIOOC|nr:unnamed protein product [Clonostachys rosea]
MDAGLAIRGSAPNDFKLDGLGTFYCCFAAIWTAILIGGMVFLYRKRDMPILRIRGLALSFGSVILLHIYWLAVQFGYLYGKWMTAGVEFWIMGIWLPFGIALFHASNSRFLYVAEMQKRFIRSDTMEKRVPQAGKKTLRQRYKALDYTTRMLAVVGTGMAIQFFLTLFMFLVSRKFHPSFGIPGTETHGTPEEQTAQAKVGWEWWPSVFWQCIWAWLVAPYILWKARGLHDSLGWRVQTIGCCIASLHATPMWLVALYVPQMGVVNQYFIPPQWIAISIMIIEILTIFLPCWEAVKHQTLRQETLESIARWEARSKLNGNGSLDTGSTHASWIPGKPRKKAASIGSSGSSVLTMDALEHTLVKNPEPLQQFSALKDFSGENIAFLRRVAEWKVKHYGIKLSDGRRIGDRDDGDDVDERASFEEALHIYTDFISSRGAEFQINLSSLDFKKLSTIFENAARIIYGDEPAPDPALPFETADWRIDGKHDAASNSSETAIVMTETTASAKSGMMDKVRFWGAIPQDFGEDVFDDAEMHIKYLVLTNTWPKYVKARRSMDSIESLEASGNSA